MIVLLSTSAVAFAAFCVWLAVRIINRRERWAKWTLAATIIGTPVLYVASFGPACWITSRVAEPHPIFNTVYTPLCTAAGAVGGSTWDVLTRFGGIGMPPNSMLVLQSVSESSTWASAGIFGPPE